MTPEVEALAAGLAQHLPALLASVGGEGGRPYRLALDFAVVGPENVEVANVQLLEPGRPPLTGTPDLGVLETELAQRLVELVPPGSGAAARHTVMTALASILGTYLAGDLAKLGREQYRRRATEMMERVQGCAELQAVQLRGRVPEIVGLSGQTLPPPRIVPADPGAPPADMHDPDGEKLVLLSAMGALIHDEEVEWWRLPGWPAARVRATPEGLELVVEANPDEGAPEVVWQVRRDEPEYRT